MAVEQSVVLNIWRTAEWLELRFARLFREHGLTLAQYHVLRILRHEGRPLPCLEIAARLVTEVPGITGLIDRLERLGLVARMRSEVDRRVVNVALTPRGLELLGQLDEPVDRLHRQLLGPLSHDELRSLNHLLEKARAAAGAL
ncbi:MAG: MarR family transcriptional regulator [Isosphaeraceae bacterium]|jgi:DNA-binding MarR family transcriptional regulator|nr:MAG: MarR family transcriptional regulator [Isosphaeraceae bacterium]